MSATSIYSHFRRHGTSSSFSSQHPPASPGDRMPGNGSIDADERTGLLSGNGGAGRGDSREADESQLNNGTGRTPYHKDSRRWVRWPMNTLHITYHTLMSNYVNVLLVFVPLGIVSGAVGWDPTTTFVLNFLAIIPLASLLSFATEELAAKLGQTMGGLLNATFGNAVELIVSIVALKNKEIRIVQASMLGSILSNILLVLGCCFLVGGLSRHEQLFNSTMASTMSSLMAVASASLIIPATLFATIAGVDDSPQENILILSRGTAIILLVLYVIYLYFQLRSHADLFEEVQNEQGDAEAGNEQEEEHLLSPIAATIVLIIITVIVAKCADYLVDSIDSIVERTGVSKTFIGLILIPIVGNAAEHVTAVIVAYKNKMDLAIGVAIGSSLQIALFLTPFLVILGWIINVDMTLRFEIFETVAFFLSGLVVTLLIMDGKSNYLEGALCLGMYLIIAVAFLVYPDNASDVGQFFPSPGGIGNSP